MKSVRKAGFIQSVALNGGPADSAATFNDRLSQMGRQSQPCRSSIRPV